MIPRALQRSFIYFSVVLALIVSPKKVYGAETRDFVMLGLGAVTMGLVTLFAVQSAREDSAGDKEIPNYNLSQNSYDALLFNKYSDLDRRLVFHQSVKGLTRRSLSLQLDSPPQNASDFQLELLGKLKQDRDAAKSRLLAPYVEVGAKAGYLYLESDSRSIPRTDGKLNPLLSGQEGRFIDEGNLVWAGPVVRGGFGALSYSAEPMWLHPRPNSDQYFLQRGSAKLTLGKLEIEAGKETPQWGYGRNGSLLFSGQHESVYQLSLGNSQPIELPGFLKILGPARSHFFAMLMDSNQTTFPNSQIIAAKFSVQPMERWELGFGNFVQLGGKGSSSSPLTYFGEAFGGGTNAANRGFVLDTRIKVEEFGIEPYAELYWEDCCNGVFFNSRDAVLLVGVFAPNLFSPRMDYSLEWVQTNMITYRHNPYASGLFYQGQGLGHPLGPDGSGVYHTLRYFFSPSMVLRTVAAHEWRRAPAAGQEPEFRYRIVSDLRSEPAPGLSFGCSIGFEKTENFNFVPGVIHHNVIGGINVESWW